MSQNWKIWCWHLETVSALAIVCAITFSKDCAFAQLSIVPDNTLETTEKSKVMPDPIDPLVEHIEGGTQRGVNLFHSFSEFNVKQGRAVYFANPTGTQNILSRVTGNNPSNILGKLGVSGSANLFLINPNGIIFGPNSSLDIRGSFLASTASSVIFSDGTQFSAPASQVIPLLSVNVPIGLQFGGTVAPISVQGAVLAVLPGKTLSLVGGDITLAGGSLTAPSGRIELGSVAGDGKVSLNQRDDTWVLGYGQVNTFKTINLEPQASVSVSGEGGGSLQIQGAQLELAPGSRISADTTGIGTSGEVNIHITNAITLSDNSRITADVSQNGTGLGGKVTIETGQLIIQGARSLVRAGTLGEGAGGNLTVTAFDSVKLSGGAGSGLFTQTQGTGAAGDLTITTRQLKVQDGARVSASSSKSGNAGNLTVHASEIELVGTTADGQSSSGLFTQTQGTGAAGNLVITTSQLRVQGGAGVSTITSSPNAGQGGDLVVTASDSVNLTGTSTDGKLSSSFSAQTQGARSAGNLAITARQLRLQDGAQILANTTASSTGQGGNLVVTASDSVELVGTSLDGSIPSSLATQSEGTGTAGDIKLHTQNLLLLRQGGLISAKADRNGNGGNITISTPLLVAVPNEDSNIIADAFTGRGGNITITAEGVFGFQRSGKQTNLSDISARSERGANGTVQINRLYTDPTRGLATLPVQPVDVSGLVAQGCPADVGPRGSRFIVSGRGGLPPNPSETLSGETVWSDLRPTYLTAQPSSEADAQQTKSTAGQLVEAQGWMINNKGEVVLTATAPNVTPYIPWLTPTRCHAANDGSS